jgi:REP element-mobilizing transposase RayT
MKFDPDIHHSRSIRLRGYDYSANGAYFVTVCVHQRECLLGKVEGAKMVLSPAGETVRSVWEGLPERFPNVMPDAFVTMPNHFHGILFLTEPPDVGAPLVGAHAEKRNVHVGAPLVGAQGFGNARTNRAGTRRAGTRPAPTLGDIIGAFKSLTTNAYIRGVEQDGWPPFPGRLWQRNYYERVIRDDGELGRARRYIEENPLQWHLDAENPANIP